MILWTPLISDITRLEPSSETPFDASSVLFSRKSSDLLHLTMLLFIMEKNAADFFFEINAADLGVGTGHLGRGNLEGLSRKKETWRGLKAFFVVVKA